MDHVVLSLDPVGLYASKCMIFQQRDHNLLFECCLRERHVQHVHVFRYPLSDHTLRVHLERMNLERVYLERTTERTKNTSCSRCFRFHQNSCHKPAVHEQRHELFHMLYCTLKPTKYLTNLTAFNLYSLRHSK